MPVVNCEKRYAATGRLSRDHMSFLGNPPEFPVRMCEVPPSVQQNPEPTTERGKRRRARKSK